MSAIFNVSDIVYWLSFFAGTSWGCNAVSIAAQDKSHFRKANMNLFIRFGFFSNVA